VACEYVEILSWSRSRVQGDLFNAPSRVRAAWLLSSCSSQSRSSNYRGNHPVGQNINFSCVYTRFPSRPLHCVKWSFICSGCICVPKILMCIYIRLTCWISLIVQNNMLFFCHSETVLLRRDLSGVFHLICMITCELTDVQEQTDSQGVANFSPSHLFIF
jgi:hypothetical protein